MQNTVETIFILENPGKNIVKFATDYQLRYNDIIKEVFGVACLNDVSMMIQFNKSFQQSICEKYGISENKVSINQIIRVASRDELHRLKKQLIEDRKQNNQLYPENESIPCPFDSIIKLKEGIFEWDEADCSYYKVK